MTDDDAHLDPDADTPSDADAARAERLRAPLLDAPTLTPDAFRTRTRRSFVTGAGAALAGVLGWRWLRTQPTDDRIPWLLRKNHELAETVWRGLYNPNALAPTFPVSASGMPPPNGGRGLGSGFDPSTWALRVFDASGQEIDRLDIDAIRALPKVEQTTEIKCIEGWSQIVHWGGARFSDVAAQYPGAAERAYVGMATPNAGYRVGMDMASMMHPQTLLCYEMQGAPLTMNHGAPLRLVTPLKYGVKHIKRLGVLQFMDRRPTDFWAERGYDWYIGH